MWIRADTSRHRHGNAAERPSLRVGDDVRPVLVVVELEVEGLSRLDEFAPVRRLALVHTVAAAHKARPTGVVRKRDSPLRIVPDRKVLTGGRIPHKVSIGEVAATTNATSRRT